MPKIGVVIRTLNESKFIGTCLDTLHQQRTSFDLDILIVDSGSTDATVEIARSRGARVLEIAPDAFDYSKALNAGIDLVPYEFVLILSAHAIPVGDQWIARMTAPFDDTRVAAVASRQVPWDDAQWDEVLRLAHTFGDERRAYTPARPGEIVFSNAASCLRRSVWRDEPFTLPAAEDLEWAARVVAAGWTVVYEAGAAVRHSHNEPARARARRLIDLERIGESPAAPRTRRRTLREAGGLVYRGARAILGLEEPLSGKLAHLAGLLGTAWYYVVDFSRPGTTAELRRDAS